MGKINFKVDFTDIKVDFTNFKVDFIDIKVDFSNFKVDFTNFKVGKTKRKKITKWHQEASEVDRRVRTREEKLTRYILTLLAN